jgi:NitT/TauT family transport system substrate-binding protein
MVLSLLFSSVTCSQNVKPSNEGYDRKIIRINVMPTYAHAMSHIIKEKGFLTPYMPNDVIVEWTNINSSPEVRDGLVSGNIDISISPSLTVIPAIENGLPLFIVSAHVTNSLGIYSKNPNMQSFQDLANANGIYINSLGSSSMLATFAMCLEEFEDALYLSNKFIAQDFLVSTQAFATEDEIECIATNFPDSEKVMQISGVHQVVDLTPYAQKYDLGNYYIANAEFYKSNPALMGAFRSAQKDALDFMVNNTDEAAEILAEKFEFDKEIIATEMKSNIPKLEVTGYDKCADLMYKAGILTNTPKKFSELENYEEIPK